MPRYELSLSLTNASKNSPTSTGGGGCHCIRRYLYDKRKYKKKIALANYLEVEVDEIESLGNDEFEYNSETYLVLDEDEAFEALWEDSENLLREAPNILNDKTYPSWAFFEAVDSSNHWQEWCVNDIIEIYADVCENDNHADGTPADEYEEVMDYLDQHDLENTASNRQEAYEVIAESIFDSEYDGSVSEYLDQTGLLDSFLNELIDDVDLRPLIQAIWDDYGPGHELASDGITTELGDDLYAFRLD